MWWNPWSPGYFQCALQHTTRPQDSLLSLQNIIKDVDGQLATQISKVSKIVRYSFFLIILQLLVGTYTNTKAIVLYPLTPVWKISIIINAYLETKRGNRIYIWPIFNSTSKEKYWILRHPSIRDHHHPPTTPSAAAQPFRQEYWFADTLQGNSIHCKSIDSFLVCSSLIYIHIYIFTYQNTLGLGKSMACEWHLLLHWTCFHLSWQMLKNNLITFRSLCVVSRFNCSKQPFLPHPPSPLVSTPPPRRWRQSAVARHWFSTPHVGVLRLGVECISGEIKFSSTYAVDVPAPTTLHFPWERTALLDSTSIGHGCCWWMIAVVAAS